MLSKTDTRRIAATGFTAGVVLFALSGCVRFEPRPILPEQNAARIQNRGLDDPSLRAFVASSLPGDSGEGPLSFWNLDALTLAAFYFHPELDVARAQWAVTEAALITAGARPGLAAGLAAGRNTTTTTPSSRLITATADLTLETAGKREYRIAEAMQLSEASRQQLASVAWQVRNRVRSSFLDLYGALESRRSLSRQQAIHADNLRILDGQYEAGAISAFELSQARLAAAAAELALRDAERREAEARARLAGAIGVPVAALDGVSLSFATLEALPEGFDVAEMRQNALLNRPDVLSALAEYAASQSQLQLAIAGQYPDISLGPGYEYDQGDDKWTLGLSMTLPADRNRGPIAEAQARREEAAARFNATQTRVLEEVDVAVAVYRAASRKRDSASAIHTDLIRQERVAQSMLEAGAISGSELVALRLQLSASELADLNALIEVQRALGQFESAVQDSLDLPGSVWEQPPNVLDSSPGGN